MLWAVIREYAQWLLELPSENGSPNIGSLARSLVKPGQYYLILRQAGQVPIKASGSLNRLY